MWEVLRRLKPISLESWLLIVILMKHCGLLSIFGKEMTWTSIVREVMVQCDVFDIGLSSVPWTFVKRGA
jgi:hypothetical protein